MYAIAEIHGDDLQALSADESLDGGGLVLRHKPALARVFGGSGPVGARRRGRSRRTQGLLVWLIHGAFLSVDKASIPCQEIGSQVRFGPPVLKKDISPPYALYN